MSYVKLEDLEMSELEAGVRKSLENADNMIEEGDLLFNKGYHARAYTLYQLAAEEVGKSRILYSLILDQKLGKEIDYKALNKDFTTHQTKSKGAIVFETIAVLLMTSNQEGSKEERKKKFFNYVESLQKEEDDIDLLNKRKNDSLYVGIKDGKFVSPKEAITEKMAAVLRTNTIIRHKAAETMLQFILRDIDKLASSIKDYLEKEEDINAGNSFDIFFK